MFKDNKSNIIGLLLGAIGGFFVGKAIDKQRETKHTKHWGTGLGAALGWFIGEKLKK